MRQKLLLTDFRYTSKIDFSDSSFKFKKVLMICAETKRKLMSSENVVLTSSVVKDDFIEIVNKMI